MWSRLYRCLKLCQYFLFLKMVTTVYHNGVNYIVIYVISVWQMFDCMSIHFVYENGSVIRAGVATFVIYVILVVQIFDAMSKPFNHECGYQLCVIKAQISCLFWFWAEVIFYFSIIVEGSVCIKKSFNNLILFFVLYLLNLDMFCFVIVWFRAVLNNPIRVCVMQVHSK